MTTQYPDLTIFAKDFPEARLIVEIRPEISSPPNQDPAVQQLVRSMWGAKCHHGLIMTPTNTYVLQDDFSTTGPDSIRIVAVLPTGKLLSRFDWKANGVDPQTKLFEFVVGAWLQRLASSYEAALPDDPEVTRIFFPDIVGAVAEGRVVGETVFR